METIADLKKPCVNDRIRVIGICLHEDFRDRLGLLIGSTQNRPELDDPGYNKDALFAEMAIKFNDPELVQSSAQQNVGQYIALMTTS